MRLISRTDLQTLIDAGPLEPKRAVALIDQIAGALHSAHQAGLVHRDIKPSNILVDPNDFAYLIDFGIARASDDTRLTSENSAIGTWAYMAPERFSTSEIHPSSDIYALACVLYQCLTGEQPFPGSTLEQVAVGHMVTPPPRPSEHAAIPPAMDQVIATGLAKKPADRYPTTVEMATAAKEAVTVPLANWTAHTPHRPRRRARATTARRSIRTRRPRRARTECRRRRISAHRICSGQPAPPASKKSGRHGILIGALVFIATLIVVGGVITFVEVTKDDKSASTAQTAAAPGPADFTGTYRADYGPGTDLDGKTVPGAPATTSNWDVRSECGASGCVATAASASGQSLLSSMTFDQLGGAWLAVGLASADCGGEQASEVWVVVTLQPQPDGTLTGETVRSSTDSLCAAKRAVKFTRTGDPDINKVPDPAVLPPRVVTPADGLRGSYRQTTTFTSGTIGTLPGKVLEAETYCLRTGDRCMSLFHASGGAVTLIFAKDKWTRNEVGTTQCAAGGTAQATITAEYPLPPELDDPIAQLNGRGTQTIAPGGACTGGGDFEDKFERTGD